mgnify:CR=1 FL=1
MATGTVKFFDEGKGFGFITPDDASPEIFMHKSRMAADALKSVKAEARVSYEVTERGGKKFASGITLIAAAPEKPAMLRFKPASKADPDPEEEFEREWGLRRAK